MKCGYVALIGRPNVGKSTLMNHLLGQKISITSRKPQTTRHRILGIKTTPEGQALFVDTPGMHDDQSSALNRYLNKAADTTLTDVDLVLWVIDGIHWNAFDDIILRKIKQISVPVILVFNKVDKITQKETLLPYFEELSQRYSFSQMVPVSALKGENLDRLVVAIMQELPEGESIFPEDQITDRSERFLVTEIVREKLTRRLGQELPYRLTVEIERYEELTGLTKIHAIIWVERKGQKQIIIGQQGEMLKQIGIDARKDIETLLETKVFLQLWVKVKKGWFDSAKTIEKLGYHE